MTEPKSDEKKVSHRPTKYREEYDRMAYKACQLGATDNDLAELFDVCEKTINNWKESYPSFLQSLKTSKADLDARVERSLYERATGYSHPEDKIFNNNGEPMVVSTEKHYPPDTGACVVWLANRQPDRWKKDPQPAPVQSEPLQVVITRATKKDA